MFRWLPYLSFLALVLLITGSVMAEEPAEKTVRAPAIADVRQTIDRGLGFLTREGVNWMDTRKCVTCHAIPMTIWSLQEAKGRGFNIDNKAFDELRSFAVKKHDISDGGQAVGDNVSREAEADQSCYVLRDEIVVDGVFRVAAAWEGATVAGNETQSCPGSGGIVAN